MVVLTIEAPSNDYTVYFDQPIPKPNYIKLLNCSLYNSWYNLKEEGKVYVYDKKGVPDSGTILSGHYTIETISEEIKDVLIEKSVTIQIKTNTPREQIAITNIQEKNISQSKSCKFSWYQSISA